MSVCVCEPLPSESSLSTTWSFYDFYIVFKVWVEAGEKVPNQSPAYEAPYIRRSFSTRKWNLKRRFLEMSMRRLQIAAPHTYLHSRRHTHTYSRSLFLSVSHTYICIFKHVDAYISTCIHLRIPHA